MSQISRCGRDHACFLSDRDTGLTAQAAITVHASCVDTVVASFRVELLRCELDDAQILRLASCCDRQ